MKKIEYVLMILLVSMLVSGCGGSMKRIANIAIWGNPGGNTFISIPPPQAGLVLPINRSPGVWVKCWLFEGHYSQDDLIIAGTKGSLAFSIKPLKEFCISPPASQPYKNGVMSTAIVAPMILPSPNDYTLLAIHGNFRGWVVEIEVKHFSTTGNGLDEYYLSSGRRIYADKVIKLKRTKPYQQRSFKIHRTFYPGNALKDALGM